MPSRYLREAYKESETINALDWPAEVVWTRLLVTVDDWGRCEANVKLLRLKIFPLRLEKVREADVTRWLAECDKAGALRLYTHQGKSFIQMMNWEKGRAAKSKYPNPPPEIASICFRLPTDVNTCLQPPAGADNGKPPPTSVPATVTVPATVPTTSTPPAPDAREDAPRLHGIPATPEEVVAYGKTLRVPKSEQQCRDFFAFYEGQRRVSPDGAIFWITSGEAVVTMWKAKLPSFEGSKHGKANQPGGTPRIDRNAGTTNEGQSSLYAGIGEVVSVPELPGPGANGTADPGR